MTSIVGKIPTLSNQEISGDKRNASSPAAGGLRSGSFAGLLAYTVSKAVLAQTSDREAAMMAADATMELLPFLLAGGAAVVAGVGTAFRKYLADKKAAPVPV